MTRCAALVGLLLAAGGCQVADEVGEEGRESLGGTTDTAFPNVCVMRVMPPDDQGTPQDQFSCTCTLIEAQTVLTSARCVSENLEKDMVDGIEIRFGSGFGDGTPFAIAPDGIILHRHFDPDASNVNELALIRLTEAPSSDPVEIISGQLSDSDVGKELTIVGFGARSESGPNDDIRNFISTPIEEVGARHVFAGTADLTTCAGDSGGPGFLDVEGDPVMAVMTTLQTGCTQSVQRARLDLYTGDFLFPFIDLYSGNCPLDGTCTTEGCRTPDRDCPENKCLWQARNDPADCQEDCPTRDWDCPIGSFVGEACAGDGECEEGGRCVAAADDESFTYCSRPCGDQGQACPTGMECSEGQCTYLTPSPGSPGAECGGDEACRSGICECGVCVVEAGLGACTQGGGGFCAVGADGSGRGLAPLALLALALPFVVRRRRDRR